MRFCRLDYEYYVEVESGIGFSEKARGQLRNLLFLLDGACMDEVEVLSLCSMFSPSGPWEIRADSHGSGVSVGIVGTPRTLFTLNPNAVSSLFGLRGPVCSIIGMLNNVYTQCLVAYVERDTIPEYILDAEDGKMHRRDSYRQHKGWCE